MSWFTDLFINDVKQILHTNCSSGSSGSSGTSTSTMKTVSVVLRANGWNSNLQTANVDGVTTTTTVFVSPSPDDTNHDLYTTNGIRCVDKAAGSLTFLCKETPQSDVTVNVAVFF